MVPSIGRSRPTTDDRSSSESGYLDPRRPHLARALAAVIGTHDASWFDGWLRAVGPHAVHGGFALRHDNVVPWTVDGPSEAWEALAAHGAIPMAWVDDPARAFTTDLGTQCKAACRPQSGGYLGHDSRCRNAITLDEFGRGHGQYARRTQPRPTTVLGAVALAADVEGVLAAEQLALELAIECVADKDFPARRPARRVAWWPIDPQDHGIHGLRDVAARSRRWRRYRAARSILSLGYVVCCVTNDEVTLRCPPL